jgi:preprotein translocase subunit SecG
LHTIIVLLHVFICLAMILIVLLQSGKGANMGAAFGGSSQTIFGSSGPGTFLGKATTVVAVVFMLTSLWLAYFAVHKNESVIRGTSAPPAAERSIDVGESAQPVAIPDGGSEQSEETPASTAD